MLKSEVQHQFWVTKKVVERKLGTKEDECIVSSDAELDAKIELFKTISDSCTRLHRIIDQYQERLCILAQEENALGKFLKETGKNSNTSGKVMICAGKAISYCGQQRVTTRPPLLRLFHEVDTFRCRAVEDTYITIMNMERERTEYRAALSWMKSASNQLDPDTGRGLDKFRKAQTHVRLSKAKFDRLSLDCLQKIDLLAAARCNMFSHALVAYMAALMHFATKSSETFKATAKALSASTQYNFCVLKDLSESAQQENLGAAHDIKPIDSDQMLFFLDEYTDEKKSSTENKTNHTEKSHIQSLDNSKMENLIEISSDENNKIVQETANILDNLLQPEKIALAKEDNQNVTNLINLPKDFDDFTLDDFKTPSFMPSQLLLEGLLSNNNVNCPINNSITSTNTTTNLNGQESKATTSTKNKSSILDFFNRPNTNNKNSSNNKDENLKHKKNNSSSNQIFKQKFNSKKDMSSWFDLFAELDPLSNPDAIARKIDGGKDNNQAA